MLRVLLALSLLLSAGILPAQVPGYLGRRTVIRLNLHSFPAGSPVVNALNSDTLSLGESLGELGLNLRFSLNAERVLSRRFSVGASLNQILTKTDYTFRGTSGDMRMVGVALGAHLHMYTFRTRGNIAPLGPYQKVGFHILRYQVRDLDEVFFPDGRRNLGNFTDLMISYSLGTQRIFADRFTWQVALEGAWVIKAFPQTLSEEDDFLYARSSSRLRRWFAINLQAGIGLLLY
ncbi:MAG: hypothetical protein AAF206_09530 [Bacteroidota bacterium]